LIITFDKEVVGLRPDDIYLISSNLSLVKGSLSLEVTSGYYSYMLNIAGNFNSCSLKVEVKKTGYAIGGQPKTVDIYGFE
jgi:hypothetical protein